MTTTAERPQYMLALDKGLEHRLERARVKRELFEAPSTVASRDACADLLLADPPPYLVTMRVVDLIAACRGTGPTRARDMVGRAGLHERKIIGQLSIGQALALAGQLRTGEQLDLRPWR